MKQLTPERQQVLALLSDGRAYSPSTIAQMLGKTRPAANKLLLHLHAKGLVDQPSYGLYALPAIPTDAPTPEPSRVRLDPGVYILRNGPYYKIGKSTNVGWRVEQLRTGLPNETIHVHTITTNDPDELERELHLKYAAKRHRGEWFELDMFDVDELCEMGAEFH